MCPSTCRRPGVTQASTGRTSVISQVAATDIRCHAACFARGSCGDSWIGSIETHGRQWSGSTSTDSPRQALAKLQSPERNGCRVDSDPHRAIVAFLESVRDAYPSRRDLIEAFVRHVPAVFGPVAQRHGLALRAIEPRLFVLESDTVRVRVRFGSGHEPDVNVLLGPASGREPGHDDRSPDIFGLGVIGKTLTDQQAFEPQKVATPQEIRRVLDTGASVLERDCAAILGGDLSLWPRLRRSVDAQPGAGT